MGAVGDGDTNPTRWSTPITKTGGKSIRSKSTKDRWNKKPRSEVEESGGEESTKKRSKEERVQAGFAVDLESMSASMKRKSPMATAARHKKDSAKKTPKKKATFVLAETAKAGDKKAEEEVAVCRKFVIGFAIQVDKGNNAKGGFNRKISEGLAFLIEYLDKAACILPSRKDQHLGPINIRRSTMPLTTFKWCYLGYICC